MTSLDCVKPVSTRVIPRFVLFSILPLLAVTFLFCSTPGTNAQTQERTKVAEGEYLIHTEDPYDTEQLLRESWVLWRIGDAGYLVESALHLEKPGGEPNVLEQSVYLSSRLRPQQIKTTSLSSKPVYRTDFQKAGDKIRVTDSEGKSTEIDWRGEDIYSPELPWTWTSLVRRAGLVRGQGYPLSFVSMDVDGPDRELSLLKSWGRAQCLGTEQLEVPSQKFTSTKYVLHLGPFSGFFVWISEGGLVLASQGEENPKERMEISKLRIYEQLPKLDDPLARKTTPHKP